MPWFRISAFFRMFFFVIWVNFFLIRVPIWIPGLSVHLSTSLQNWKSKSCSKLFCNVHAQWVETNYWKRANFVNSIDTSSVYRFWAHAQTISWSIYSLLNIAWRMMQLTAQPPKHRTSTNSLAHPIAFGTLFFDPCNESPCNADHLFSNYPPNLRVLAKLNLVSSDNSRSINDNSTGIPNICLELTSYTPAYLTPRKKVRRNTCSTCHVFRSERIKSERQYKKKIRRAFKLLRRMRLRNIGRLRNLSASSDHLGIILISDSLIISLKQIVTPLRLTSFDSFPGLSRLRAYFFFTSKSPKEQQAY